MSSRSNCVSASICLSPNSSTELAQMSSSSTVPQSVTTLATADKSVCVSVLNCSISPSRGAREMVAVADDTFDLTVASTSSKKSDELTEDDATDSYFGLKIAIVVVSSHLFFVGYKINVSYLVCVLLAVHSGRSFATRQKSNSSSRSIMVDVVCDSAAFN
jgi:hypothetical protein